MKKFIKNNAKLFVGVLIGLLIGMPIASVYATYKYNYQANEVQYNEDKDVAEVLDELYANKMDVTELKTLKNLLSKADATENDIAIGKKAYSNGDLITGKLFTEKSWTLVISYSICIGWNGNVSYGCQNGKMTVVRKNGGTPTITNTGGAITSRTEHWNGNYYINSHISSITIDSFTIDS